MGSGETVRRIKVTHVPTLVEREVYIISSHDRVEIGDMGMSRKQLLEALEVDEQEVKELNGTHKPGT